MPCLEAHQFFVKPPTRGSKNWCGAEYLLSAKQKIIIGLYDCILTPTERYGLFLFAVLLEDLNHFPLGKWFVDAVF
jgi:hypothetical protein